MATPVDVLRMGNKSGPTLDKADRVKRGDDATLDPTKPGWVKGGVGTKGASTFDNLKPGDKIWKAPAGTVPDPDIVVHKDGTHHYSWSPAKDMTIDDFLLALGRCNSLFQKTW